MTNQITFNVITKKEKDNWGKYIISPLPAGFGHTIGNSLRRTLLGALPGAAVIQMKTAGATHIFTGLKGVKEDLVAVMLNVRQIRFVYQKEKPVILKLEKTGLGIVKAGNIKAQPGVKIVNPNLVLAHLTGKKTRFKVQLTVARGVGYVPAEEHKSNKLGVIALDAVFTPVKKVNYQVEPVRKGKKTNFDKLTLEIWTDGSLKPKQAMRDSAKILTFALEQIANPKKRKKIKKKVVSVNNNLDLLIEEVDEIPLRLTNALKAAGYRQVKDLVKVGRGKILAARNVGEKSVQHLIKVLKKKKIKIE